MRTKETCQGENSHVLINRGCRHRVCHAARRMREDKESSSLCTDIAEIRSISEAMLGGNGPFLLKHFKF